MPQYKTETCQNFSDHPTKLRKKSKKKIMLKLLKHNNLLYNVWKKKTDLSLDMRSKSKLNKVFIFTLF